MSLFQAVPSGYVLTSGANSALTWTNALTTSTVNTSTMFAGRLNYSSLVGSSISTNAMTLSLTNASTQNTRIYQVATTNPTTSYTAIQASHVSTGTTNNALALNPSGGNVGVGVTTASAPLHVNTASSGLANGVLLVNSNNTLSTAVNSSDILQQWSESTGNGNNVSLLWNRTTAGSDWTTASQRFQARTDASWQGFIEFNGTNNNNGVTIGAGNNTSNPNNVSSVMTIKTGGNVGIGTTAPIAPLHVYNSAGISLSNTSTVNYTQSATLGFNYGGGSVGTRDSFRIVSNVVNRDNGAGPTFYDYGAQADLVFQRKTNNLYSSGANDTTYTEVMRLGGATGNVGIGYTTPAATLHVLNPTAQAGNTTMVTAQIIGRPGTAGVQDGTSCGFAIGASGGLPNAASRMDVMVGGTAYSGNNWGYTPDIPVATFLGNGNVGIGTTAPGALLHVNGTVYPSIVLSDSTNTSDYMELIRDHTVNTSIIRTTGILHFESPVNYKRMTFLTNGNVGIGTTSPSVPLHVVGSATITTGTTSWMTKGSGGLATSGGPVTFNTVSIYAAGSIWAGDVIGCANVNSFSDQRIKENIQPISSIFDLIHQVEIVSYDHIDVRKKSVRIGVVAQQLQPFFPEIIDKAKNWVPVPYTYATSHERHDDCVVIMVDASASELQVGRQIRLYIGKNDTETQYDTEILERTPTSITCKVWGDTYDATDRVFVYGVEVDDFLVVDKAQLGLLALAGVQEIHKTMETLQAQNEALQAQNETLQAQNEALQAQNETLQVQHGALQSQLASLIAWAQTQGYSAPA